MSKIARATQSIFGSTASASQIAKFGSLAAGTPTTYSGATATAANIQALSNYLGGWFSAVIGGNSPAIEDMNAIHWLFSYQLSYILQEGIPEWDSGTTYYKGSLAQDGSGNVYVSITDSNTNNALSSTTNWRAYLPAANMTAVNPAGGTYQSPYAMTSGDLGKTFLVNSANGAMQFNLPSPSTGFWFEVQDVGAALIGGGTKNITLHRHAAENIQGVAADYVFASPWGAWTVSSDGTNWFIN